MVTQIEAENSIQNSHKFPWLQPPKGNSFIFKQIKLLSVVQKPST